MRTFGLFTLSVVFLGCATGGEQGEQGDQGEELAEPIGRQRHGALPWQAEGLEPPSALAGAPFDISAVMAQVEMAFRADGGEFRGHHASYRSTVHAGTLRVVPRHQPVQGEPTVLTGAALTVETTSIVRGSRTLDFDGRGSRVTAEGQVRVRGADGDEQFRNREEGVEQSWLFDSEPRGDGDLVVRVRVDGQTFVGETSEGLHFADERSGVGFRYGLGTWIDADGARTGIRGAYENGHVVLRVPAAIVHASAYPAVLDPIVSPEFGMDDPVTGPVDGARAPEIVYGGGHYFLAWWDTAGSPELLIGTRVAPDGTLLDPAGIHIASSSTADVFELATDGSDFVVVYGRNYATAVRVSGAGVVLDSTGIRLSGHHTFVQADVAFDGTHYVVVWVDESSGVDRVHTARLTPAGTLLDPAPGIPVSTPGADASQPAVDCDGTNCLAVWRDERNGLTTEDIYGARIGAAGTVVDPFNFGVVVNSEDLEMPELAFDGTNYLVVWQAAGGRLRGRRVTPAAGLLDGANGFEIFPNWMEWPRVSHDGTNFVVAYARVDSPSFGDRSIYATRVSSSGGVLDASGVAVNTSGDEFSPAIASDGTQSLIVWETAPRDMSGSRVRHIEGSRLSSAGSVVPPTFQLDSRGNAEERPSAAFDGTNYLVVWHDDRGGLGTDVFGVRVSASGTVVDASAIPIATGTGEQRNPMVAFNGTNYLVVWEEGTSGADLYAARVSTSGAVLDSPPITINTEAGASVDAAVASDGSGWFVGWSHAFSSSSIDIYGVRISSAGAVLGGPGSPISTASRREYRPDVAFDGANYVVAWESEASSLSADVVAKRVLPDGTVLDPSPILISSRGREPSIASDGTASLVVFTSARRADEFGGSVEGRRLARDGSVLDGSDLLIGSAMPDMRYPGVVWKGRSYFVTWVGEDGSIRANWVSDDGAPLESDGTALTVPAAAPVAPTVASGGVGEALIAYQRPAGALADRVYAVHVSLDALGTSCSEHHQCASGFCVDSVCCESACGGGVADDCVACAALAGASADGTCTALSATSCEDGLGCTATGLCDGGTCMGSGDPCLSGTSCSEAGGGAYECSPCPAGTHSVDGSGATECVACRAGFWSGVGATSCAEWTDCPPGSFVSTAGTPTSDQVCSACAAGAYTALRNEASCAAWRECAAGSYVSTAGTAMNDRVCTTCAMGSYTDTANATSCAAWTDCVAGTYASTAGTTTTDRTCSGCSAGTYTDAENAMSCAAWRDCAAGTYVAAAGTTTRDRSCTACAAGSYSAAENAASCAPWGDCAAGTYVSTAGTTTRDRACTACAAGSYSDGENAASCVAWGDCAAGTYVSTAGTTTANRACMDCSAGTFTATANEASCSGWAACGSDEYESTPPSPTRDRVCTMCRACEAHEVEVMACTATVDTVCEPRADAGPPASPDAALADVDGGYRDAAAADGSVEPPIEAGCGCTAVGSPSGPDGIVFAGGLVAALALHRRRRRVRRGRG